MESSAVSIIIGIVSSLFATAIFIILSEFIRRVAIPWYEDKIYRGVRIDGKWELLHLGDEDELIGGISMQLHLKQKGDVISGTYMHSMGETTYNYLISGKIRDMYFLATAVPASNRQIDGMSLLLHIQYEKSKLKMQGGVLYEGSPGKVKDHIGITFVWKNS